MRLPTIAAQSAAPTWALVVDLLVVAAAAVSILAVRLRFAPARARLTGPAALARARAIVAAHGEDSLAPFILRPDKTMAFGGGAVAAYRRIGRVAVVSGDPVGPRRGRARRAAAGTGPGATRAPGSRSTVRPSATWTPTAPRACTPSASARRPSLTRPASPWRAARCASCVSPSSASPSAAGPSRPGMDATSPQRSGGRSKPWRRRGAPARAGSSASPWAWARSSTGSARRTCTCSPVRPRASCAG